MNFFTSLVSDMDNVDMTHFAVLDYHLSFQQNYIPQLDSISLRDQGGIDYRNTLSALKTFWASEKTRMTAWMNASMNVVSQIAQSHNIICGNTKGWGADCWFDHPELDWSFIKETAEISIDLLQAYPNFKLISTSNFTQPQFRGLWEDVQWHKQMTAKIRRDGSSIQSPVTTTEINLYPNPFKNELHLTHAAGFMLQIYTVNGTMVHTQKVVSQNETIYTERLPAGVCFFKMEKDGETKTIKAIKI
jgi:hypothetical protein